MTDTLHKVGCKMPGCDRKHHIRGFCTRHYEWVRTGRIDRDGKVLIPVRQKGGRRCKIDGCDREYTGTGFCVYHRTQYRRGIIDLEGKTLRDLIYKPTLEKCKVEGCNGPDNGKGFCSKHRYQYRTGAISVEGKKLRLLEYEKEFDRRGIHKKSQEFVLNRYFGGGPLCRCSVCGGDFEFYQMDGHHPDRSKKTMTPTTMLARAVWNHPEMIAELDSLQWMCCNCHRIIEGGGENTLYAETNSTKLGKMRDKVIDAIFDKRGLECEDCHGILGRRTVVFHHRNPLEKAACISRIIGQRRMDFVLAETDKCALLCTLCHRKRHYLNKELRGNVEIAKKLLSMVPKEKHIRSNGRCRVEGCDRKHDARGFCHKHRYQFNAGVIDENGILVRNLYLGTKRGRVAHFMPANLQPSAFPERPS